MGRRERSFGSVFSTAIHEDISKNNNHLVSNSSNREKNFFNYINNNPLYIHNQLDPILKTTSQISGNINYKNLFDDVIDRLKKEEEIIYKNLGEGDLELGKKRVKELTNNIYSNNAMRIKVIRMIQQLFGRVDIFGKPVSIQSTKGSLPISVNYSKGNLVVKKGKNSPEKSVEKIQEILTIFCDNWNSFVSNYEQSLEEVKECVLKGSIDWDSNRFVKLYEYLQRAKEELQIASTNNYKNLSDSFYEVVRQKTGYFGDIIGIFNEVVGFKFEDNVDSWLNNGLKSASFKFERGDDIDRAITQKSTNSKADNVITISNQLNIPNEQKVTSVIGVSLKFSSGTEFKAHSGSLNSIPNLIEGEPGGKIDANYLRYLIINTAIFDKDVAGQTSKVIYKILQKYLYLFLSGSLEDVLQSKAVFMSATLAENGVESYFFPISSLLLDLEADIKQDKKVITWAALGKDGFGISAKDREVYLAQVSEEKSKIINAELKNNTIDTYGILSNDPNLKQKDLDIYNQLSSSIGDKGIRMNNKFLIRNISKIIL